MLVAGKSCPVCTSEFICDLQPIYLQRQKRHVPQHFCMDCRSFFHVSGYKEDDDQLAGDTEWLKAHPHDYADLIKRLKKLFPKARTCFEAGCGVGTLLSQLQAAGFRVQGVDPNPSAVAHAVKHYGVEASCGYFSGLASPVDIIFAIDVMEHLEVPRTFFADLVRSVHPGGGIVVRVPFVGRDQWHHLWTAGSAVEHDWSSDNWSPFRDNSVHITHFSPKGLQAMGESLGASLVRECGDLYIFSPSPAIISQPSTG